LPLQPTWILVDHQVEQVELIPDAPRIDRFDVAVRLWHVVLQVAVPDVEQVLGLLVILSLKVEVAAVAPDEDGPDHRILLPLKANRKALRKMLEVALVVRRIRHFEDGNMDSNE